MIDNCASLLPNVVHSYLPNTSLKVALFVMYLFVCLGFTFIISTLLQILKERYRIKSTLNHSSRGSTWSGLFKWYIYSEEIKFITEITDRLADYTSCFELKRYSLRK